MTTKNFKRAPKPSNNVSLENIEAFEKGGVGKDRDPQNHKPSNVGIVSSANSTATKRLSLDLPADEHTRFKTACSATGRKMTTEIQSFIQQRTLELEQDATLRS